MAASLNLPHTHESLAIVEVHPSESGAPEVFLGAEAAAISISLSHRAGVAACLVGPTGSKLGCDIEIVEPRSQAFLDDYFTQSEHEIVGLSPIADRDKVINLLWSAKESALKALGQGLRLDTRSLTVTIAKGLSSRLQDERENSAIPTYDVFSEATHWQPLQVACDSGQVFSGWWRQVNLFLHTLVASPTANRPALLVLPECAARPLLP